MSEDQKIAYRLGCWFANADLAHYKVWKEIKGKDYKPLIETHLERMLSHPEATHYDLTKHLLRKGVRNEYLDAAEEEGSRKWSRTEVRERADELELLPARFNRSQKSAFLRGVVLQRNANFRSPSKD
jgi:hypothetical protein